MTEIATLPFADFPSRILLMERKELIPENAGLLVFDSNTAALFPSRNPEHSILLPPGESAKDMPSVERILNRAMASKLGRDDCVTGIGGGVVTDVTAFAASLYMRGCRLLLVPTTLLAMVDAAVGGKTGINFAGAKNLVGTFYPASEVRICPELLETLPEREYLSGLAEVIKHALLSPDELMPILTGEKEAVLERHPHVIQRLIPAAVRVKTKIVSSDLREAGNRAFLNLGHTFGHALEVATNYSQWSHGEAVAWGIQKALDTAELLGIGNPGWTAEARRLISDYGFDRVSPQIPAKDIIAAMVNDKKKKSGRLRFVLLKGPGEPVVQEVPEPVLNDVLK